MNETYFYKHSFCFNYENEEKNATISCIDIEKGRKWESDLYENKIIFILKGTMFLSFGKYINVEISSRKMISLPKGNHYIFYAKENLQIIICRLRTGLRFCEQISFEKLYANKNRIYDHKLNSLDIHANLWAFLYWLSIYINGGLKCKKFSELKIKELLYLLKEYYSKADLQNFFYPLVTNDTDFCNFILNNYKNVKTVSEFASLANYSISGFEKRFKKSFGISAYQWMKEQKAKNIFHEIKVSDKALKEICWAYDFSSLSQFNDFCKSHFGLSPGKLRKEDN